MTDPIARTYLSLGAFYASDPARRTSRERDVGLFWRSRRARRTAPRGCATPASCTCSSTRSAAPAVAASTCSRP